MATVINLPQQMGVGEALGQAAGAGLADYFEREKKKREAEQEQKALAEVLNSADRTAAIEKVVKIGGDPQVMKRRMDVVESAFPAKDTTPMEVKSFNPETGQMESRFIPRGQLESLSTPEGKAKVLGSEKAIVSPTMEEFYRTRPDGSYEYAGKAPIETPPPGAVPLKELERMERVRSGQRAEERAALADKKFNALLERQSQTQEAGMESKEIGKAKAYNAVVANLLNVKKSIGDQGQIIIDFEGDSKRADAYKMALENATDYIKKYKGDINKAAVNALKDSGYYTKIEEPPAPTAPAESKPKGLITSLYEKVTGKSSAQTPAKPAATAAVAKPQTKAEFDKIKKGERFINPKDGKEYIKD